MDEAKKKRLTDILDIDFIPVSDVPKLELYMDQLTSFMEGHLEDMKRYPEDKIMTKTMINNYSKNHLIPPSNKKKYSKEHLYLILMIYYMKNMLSISDIQSLLFPLGTEYYPAEEKSGLTIEEIYRTITGKVDEASTSIREDILRGLKETDGLFSDPALTKEQSAYLDDFSLIFRLCYEIILRKKMIENIIDYRKEQTEKEDSKKAKDSRKRKK